MYEVSFCLLILVRRMRLELTRSFIALGIVLISLLWLLQLDSGIAHLTAGHILMFRSHAFGNWLRYLIPTILPCMYSIELLDKWPSKKLIKLHEQRNSRCLPGSMIEKSYPFMRVISFVFMGLSLVAFYCFMMWMNGFAFHDYVQIAGETSLVCIEIIWILLTFIAFFQLPNPRGYKIYNWVSLCFPLGLFLPIYFEGNAKMETIGVVLGIIGFFSLVSYLTFTFIRAFLYRIPRDVKFEGIDAL